MGLPVLLTPEEITLSLREGAQQLDRSKLLRSLKRPLFFILFVLHPGLAGWIQLYALRLKDSVPSAPTPAASVHFQQVHAKYNLVASQSLKQTFGVFRYAACM